jgi:hypothetical protein
VVAFGLTGLLLVIALAARGGHPTGEGHVTTRAVPASLQDSLVTLLAITYVVAIVGVIILFFRRQPMQVPPESRWLRNFVMVIALGLVATLVGYWAIKHAHFHRGRGRPQGVVGAPQQPQGGSRVGSAPVRSARFQWPLAAGLGGLFILGGVAILVMRRRESIPADVEEAVEAALIHAVDVTIDDLRRESDPRRAIVAAYASMERVLAAHGLPRPPADAPLEYLARILLELEVRESAVRTLTQSFEYARFSPHEIGPAMKDEAIAALVAVRADLLAEESVAA